MKSIGYSILAGAALFATVFVICLGVTNWVSKNSWNIPFATDMAAKAYKVQNSSTPFYKLRKAVVASIEFDADRGSRKTEVYVGDFDMDARQEIIRQLTFRGYKTELTSPLSGKDDFLEISW